MSAMVPYGVAPGPLYERNLPVRVVTGATGSALTWGLLGGLVGLFLRNGWKGVKYGATAGAVIGGIGALATYDPERVHMAGPAAATIGAAAKAQIQAAIGGSWIDGLHRLDAAEVAVMAEAPTNVTGANLKGAYWLGVAARIAQSRSLAATAAKWLAQGAAEAAVPGGNVTDAAAVRGAMQQVAAQVNVYMRDLEPQQVGAMQSVKVILARMGDVQQIEGSQGWGQWAWDHKGVITLGTLAVVGAGAGYRYRGSIKSKVTAAFRTKKRRTSAVLKNPAKKA